MFGFKMPWTRAKEKRLAKEAAEKELAEGIEKLRAILREREKAEFLRAVEKRKVALHVAIDNHRTATLAAVKPVTKKKSEEFKKKVEEERSSAPLDADHAAYIDYYTRKAEPAITGGGGTFDGGGASGDWGSSPSDSGSSSCDSSSSSSDGGGCSGGD